MAAPDSLAFNMYATTRSQPGTPCRAALRPASFRFNYQELRLFPKQGRILDSHDFLASAVIRNRIRAYRLLGQNLHFP